MSTPSSPPRPARPSWRRRLTRHALRFLLVAAVLLGPNLVFFGRWFVPDTPIPAVPAAVDPMDTAGLPPALASDFAAAVAAGRSRAGLPSVSAAIAWGGDVRWAGVSGFADIERGVAATTASRYRTGSLAKPITAVAMMRLADAGALELDAPLSDSVPDLPPHIAPLTARQLASHRAGIRHYSRVPQWWMGWHENYSRRPYASVAEGLSMFVDDPLRFAPGTGFQYSTFGYSLLARALESASGDDFRSLLRDSVCVPAGMTGTAVDAPGPMAVLRLVERHAATAGRRFDEPGELRARLADRRVGAAAGPRPPGDALASRWRAAGRGRVPDGPAAARPRGRGDVQFRQRPGPRGSAGNRLCARAAGDRARRRDDADGPRPLTAAADSAIMAVPPPRSCR